MSEPSGSTQYIVSARKYRPSTFSAVVGQKNLTATLKNAIETQRLAQAYLFCGPRGVGKTSCARIFAKTINCLSPTPDGDACGECASCKAIEKGNSFNLLELDAASNNGVDHIRSITEQVAVPPQMGRYKVVIIDEVHMLTAAAFNAFLKTLEEPPEYVIFILATTEKHKVIPTILSRCQIYDFKRITINDIVEHLQFVAQSEGIHADARALGVVARRADGAMRDALSIFDQMAASTRGEITYESAIANLNILDSEYFFKLVDAFVNSDVPEALLLYKEIRDKGFDSLFFINSLASHVRDLTVAVDSRTLPLLETDQETARLFAEQARKLPARWYYAALKLLNDCDLNYRTATNKQLLVELTLIRLCQLLGNEPGGEPSRPKLTNPATEPVRRSAPSAGASPTSVSSQSAPAPVAGMYSADAAVTTDSEAPYAPSSPAPMSAAPPTERQRRPAPTPGGRQASPPRTFSLKEGVAGKVADPTQGPRTASYTPDRFREVWNEFIASHPSRFILVGAMKDAFPESSGDHHYLLKVDHPAQVQQFESDHEVVEFLRDRLENDLITLTVQLNSTAEIKKPLPTREFLRKVVTENPVMGKFMRDIEAEIV